MNRTRAALVVLALTAAALCLRMYGIEHCLPHTKEADAHMALHVERLREGTQGPDPRNNDNQYPIVLPGLLSLVPSTEAPLAERTTVEQHLDAAARVYLETRVEIALLSVLLVPLTYLLARRFVSRGWALLASALIAFSFTLEFFGQQARPHAAAASFFLAAVLAAMRLARSPTWKSWLAACTTSALAIGVLHSGIATLIPLLAAGWIGVVFVVHEPARKLAARLVLTPLALLAVAAAAVFLFYPYLRRDSGAAEFDKPLLDGGQLVWGDHRLGFADFRGAGFITVARTLWFYEPLLAVLLVLALGALLARKLDLYRSMRRWSDFWIAFAFAGPYLLAIGLFERTFERFSIPLLPYGATFAAWGLAVWCSKLSPTQRRVVASVSVLALAIPLWGSARLAHLRASDDTLERAAQWLAAQPDAATTRIWVMPLFDLPLARSRESLQPSDKHSGRSESRWSIYQRRIGPDVVPRPHFDLRYLVPRPDLGFDMQRTLNEPLEYVRALGLGYYVIDVSRQPFSHLLERLRDALRECGELVHPQAPEAGSPFGFPFEDELVPGWPNVFARALRVDAVGPALEIYRVR